MNVSIVAITKPAIELMSTEQFIGYCARVSNPSNQGKTNTTEKLLKYCIKNSHWSIFEMVNIVMEINTTRDIARQILRHRFSFQEFSQRYADPTALEFETREARLQDEANRQNSLETDDQLLQKTWIAKQDQIIHETRLAYKWALENNIAKEVARCILPEGNTASRLYVNGTLRNWIHYCQLRMGNGTQKEHREIAKQCWSLLQNEFKFLKDYDNESEKL